VRGAIFINIVEIRKENLEERISDVMTMILEQMEFIGEEVNKYKIHNSLKNALKDESRARLFISYIDNELVGMCFLNICSGLASGGDYIWINEINIREKFRGQGYGSIFIKYIKEWAQSNGCKYIAAMASKQNDISKRLFNKNGFNDSEIVWLDTNI